MSDQRINLAGLADAIAMKDVYIVGADDDVLLALVEAVESAHELTSADGWENTDAQERLTYALARFSFGERP